MPKIQRNEFVEKTISKLHSISEKLSVINKFAALRAPILHIKAPNDVAQKIFEVFEVKSVVANVREKMTEQCQTQSTGSSLWGLSRISSRAPPNYNGAHYSYNVNGGSGVRV